MRMRACSAGPVPLAELHRPDALAALLPPNAGQMPVAWNAICVPGPPAAFALTDAELHGASPLARFHRRLIALLDCAAADGDRLALVDKAIPHAQLDLMLSEASAQDKPSPCDVAPATGQALWRSGLAFVRFVSRADVIARFGLGDGALQLALNCDPHTRDRESVQAAKQFHLHLLYWTRAELAPLATATEHAADHDARTRRQLLDPLTFVGARLATALLQEIDLGIAGAAILPCDDADVIAGRRPPGALIQLPGWDVLADAAFETLVRRLHQRLDKAAALLRAAFTGVAAAPPSWRRHPLRSPDQVRAALSQDGLGQSPDLLAELALLAQLLRDLSPEVLARLRRGSPAVRKHLLTLNAPAYALNLFAPGRNRPEAPVAASDVVYLSVQPKLFSGTGGAGLLALDGMQSVRIRRGVGHFDSTQWRQRTELQRSFALYNAEQLRELSGLNCGPVRSFVDCEQGWV